MTTTDLPEYCRVARLYARANALGDQLKHGDDRIHDVLYEILHCAYQLLILTVKCAEARVLAHFELLRAEALVSRDWEAVYQYVSLDEPDTSPMRLDIALAREIDEALHA